MGFPYPINLKYVFSQPAFSVFCPVDFLDTDHDPVLEGRSVLHKRKKENYTKCPYKDSRYHHLNPMNFYALKLLQNYQLEIFSFVSNYRYYLAERGINNQSQLTISEIYQLVYSFYKIPAYYLFDGASKRKSQPEIPPALAALSRLAHGLMHLLAHLVQTRSVDINSHIPANDLYHYADSHQLLVGRKEVCAGSPQMIKRYLNYIYTCLDDRTHTITDHIRNSCHSFNQYANNCYLMEITTLIYEIVRCGLWHWRNKMSNLNDAESILQDIDQNEPKSRYAITHALIAIELSKQAKPFNSDIFKRLYKLSWDDPDGLLKHNIDQQLSMATNILNKSNSYPLSKLVNQWKEMENKTLEIVCRINNRMITLFDCSEKYRSLETSDFNIFFGKSPLKVSECDVV